ncbi:hypothetical protein NMG60_11018003 [Bertholletia excelsa]
MYADTGLMFPYFQNFSQEVQQLEEEFCRSHKANVPLVSLVQTSTISEYDLGGEGDLFKAPEPIIEEPPVSLDPMTAAISMISCVEDVISPQTLEVSDIESIQNDQLLSEVFYECKKDILAKEAIETQFSDVTDIKIPAIRTEENSIVDIKPIPEGSCQKSVSFGSLSTVERVNETPIRPNFLDFGMDLSAVYGMRRAFSEGDIETLGNGIVSLIHSPLGNPQIISNCTSEDRREKLSRYRNKKTKRNFGRKIKYACRKALADSQPRVRGRFAKTEESDISKNQ